jgi:hypothetical protein
METTVKLYTFGYNEVKTYLYAALFIAGNLLLPQLCHLVPQGGFIFLPIYFFTLIGAYKYGWQLGLLTAVCSPLLNHWLFGMPPSPVLAQILVKSVVLALSAAYIARRSQSVTIPLLIAVVVFYQLVGSAAEWGLTGSLQAALQDARIGIPGMLLQVFGGYAVIKYCLR